MAEVRVSDGEVKHWQQRVKIAKAIIDEKRKEWKKNVDRYANRNCGTPAGIDPNGDVVRVNMLFSNVKTKLPALVFGNPDINAVPRQEVTSRDARLRA